MDKHKVRREGGKGGGVHPHCYISRVARVQYEFTRIDLAFDEQLQRIYAAFSAR